MIYISCDIETSGLDPINNDILSIGAIIEDPEKMLPFSEIPKWHCGIVRREIKGSPFAISLNKDLIKNISDYIAGDVGVRKNMEKTLDMIFLKPEDVVSNFYRWLTDNGVITIPPEELTISKNGEIDTLLAKKNIKPAHLTFAGKNFGTFDRVFLERLPRWQQAIKVKQRIIDPAVLFVNWKEDKELPNLKLCKERAGVSGEVTHNAIEDAWDTIQVLRAKY